MTRNRIHRAVGSYVVVLAVLGFLLVSCGARRGAADLRVEGLELTLHQSGARILTGTVFNDADRTVRGVQVQITLFDDKNRRVDEMFAVVRDVPARGSVDFRKAVQSDFDVQGARVRSILIITP